MTERNTHYSFGAWVRRRRRALDLTQEELADLAGCSIGAIRKIETDERRPSKDLAAILADRLQVPPAERVAFLRTARAEQAVDRLPDADGVAPPSPVMAPQLATTIVPAARPPGGDDLPVPATELIGRRAQMDAAAQLIRQAGIRLLTLTGPGGIGKSRLALELAHALRDVFPDGVWFIALAPVLDPALVLPTIVNCLPIEPHGRPPIEVLSAFLGHKHALLVLDNFEQVLPAASDLAALLARTAGPRLLVTSRERLHLTGEHELAIPPLDLPPSGQLVGPREALRYPAVELFMARARQVRPDLALTEELAPAVLEICRRLDGLPLAIELAAARSRLFTPTALLARLSSRLGLLTGGPRDLPARQQTLRGAIDWSYNLLSAEEQLLFCRLSVFVGGWTIEAAEAVVWDEPEQAGDTLSLLESLADKNLIRPVDGMGGEPRFVMLETIREYALEQLGQHADHERVRRRHVEHFLALATTDTAELRIPGGYTGYEGSWLQRLDQEHSNLRAAVDWCFEPAAGEERVLLGLRMTVGMELYWYFRGDRREAINWMARGLERAGEARPGDEAGAYLRARALGAIARITSQFDDLDKARGYGERALALFEALDDDEGMTWVYVTLAYTAGAALEYEQSMAYLGHAMVHARRLVAQGKPRTPGSFDPRIDVLAHQADLELRWRNYARAAANYQEILALLRASAPPIEWSWALRSLAEVLLHWGRYDQAIPAIEEALAIDRANKHVFGITLNLGVLGLVVQRQGDIRRAIEIGMEALTLHRRLGLTGQIAFHCDDLARMRMQLGEFDAARALFAESIKLLYDIGDTIGICYRLEGLAELALAHGNADRAARLAGAITGHLARFNHTFNALYQEGHAATLTAARQQLGDAGFTAVFAAGEQLTLDQAIMLGLGEP